MTLILFYISLNAFETQMRPANRMQAIFHDYCLVFSQTLELVTNRYIHIVRLIEFQ